MASGGRPAAAYSPPVKGGVPVQAREPLAPDKGQVSQATLRRFQSQEASVSSNPEGHARLGRAAGAPAGRSETPAIATSTAASYGSAASSPSSPGATQHGSGLGELRWVVERTFAWMHSFRRLRIRWERLPEIQEAFMHLACAVVCQRYPGCWATAP
jgi:hypothetical protein